MQMKQYNKTYEDVFSTDRLKGRSGRKLNLDQITVGDDINLDEYISLFSSFLVDSYIKLFDISVRFEWLRRRFSYYGEKASPGMTRNSPIFCIAFTKLVRRAVGRDAQVLTRSKFFQNLISYLDVFFPEFASGNPFKDPESYKFPFKNISIDFLSVVHQLDDRIDLLTLADERKMNYAMFLDYVINHVLSVNEEIGRERYRLKQNRWNHYHLIYVEDVDKLPKRK